MHAYPKSYLSIIDMCAISGLKRRNLFYHFKKFTGNSPYMFFIFVRVNEIRKQLQNSNIKNVKISEPASEYNFLHPGEFSILYKKIFGISPSQSREKE